VDNQKSERHFIKEAKEWTEKPRPGQGFPENSIFPD